MRLKRISQTLGLLLILVFPVIATDGTINHGFQWGVEIGDVFSYRWTIRDSDGTNNMDFDYYIVVDDLPAIALNISEIPRISDSSNHEPDYVSFFFMNDTEITPNSIGFDLYWYAYPIGNWSFIQEDILAGVNITLYEIQIFDTDSEWGISFAEGEVYNRMLTQTVKYSKETGVLTLSEIHAQNSDGSFFRSRISIIENVPIYLTVGIVGSLMGVVAVVLFILRRRGT